MDKHTYHIIADVILIVMILALGYYLYIEVDAVKIAGSDVCKLCMQKTNATCIKDYSPTVVTRQPINVDPFSNINFSTLK